MDEEPWYIRREREAAERVASELSKPSAESEADIGEEFFDPWSLFPSIYGTYSGEFDACAIEVLTELETDTKVRHDLGAEMFREMLCTAELCSYGTSPRVCFPNSEFREMLPDLIAKWKQYYRVQWGDAYDPSPSHTPSQHSEE